MPAVDASADARRLRRGSVLAGIGDGMAATALPLLAAELTHDALAVAGVVAAQHVPWLISRLVAPALVTTDRRTVVGAADAARAVVMGWLGLLVLAGAETLTVVVLTAIAVGAGEALTDDAEVQATGGGGPLGAVASRGMVGVALIGLPAGGLLYEVFPATPLVVNVLVYAMAGLLTLLMRTELAVRPTATAPAHARGLRPPAGAGMATGVATVVAASSGSALGVLVLFAVRDLDLGAPAFGVLLAGMAVASGIGATAATVVGRVVGLRAALASSLVAGAAGYGAAATLADPELPLLSALGLGVGAAGGMAAGVLLRVVIASSPASRSAEGLRGFHAMVWAGVIAGALAGGALAEAGSVPHAVWAAAGGLVVAAVAAPFVRPREIS